MPRADKLARQPRPHRQPRVHGLHSYRDARSARPAEVVPFCTSSMMDHSSSTSSLRESSHTRPHREVNRREVHVEVHRREVHPQSELTQSGASSFSRLHRHNSRDDLVQGTSTWAHSRGGGDWDARPTSYIIYLHRVPNIIFRYAYGDGRAAPK